MLSSAFNVHASRQMKFSWLLIQTLLDLDRFSWGTKPSPHTHRSASSVNYSPKSFCSMFFSELGQDRSLDNDPECLTRSYRA